MSSDPTLDGMPLEITESIVAFLPLADICSLRLTARNVSVKSSTGVFKSHFRNKRIALNDFDRLEQAVYIAGLQSCSSLLESLTLVADRAVFDGDLQQGGKTRAQLLGRALELFCLNSTRGCLPSISLVVDGRVKEDRYSPYDMAVYMDQQRQAPQNERSICETTAQSFNDTLQVIAKHNLPIEDLNIFGNLSGDSLHCDQVTSLLAKADLSTSLQGLKQLSMSLTYYDANDTVHTQQASFGKTMTQGICQLLQLCHSLKDLKIHWYTTPPSLFNRNGSRDATQSEEHQLLTRIAESCQFSSLERLTLRGIHTTAPALLLFLRLLQLRSFKMEEVHLSPSF
ncbi:hypothetical protein LSUE1_G000417 [Lachnellula suecica]|uniref:F-box domain-containing protein n=1 Tax=Lachnellula suecica TaxID=602035 RepID=A0A8T9CLV2_9HELO|nr:hypothetical protein LSUE1_G000417 [Lachnellula suecica]